MKRLIKNGYREFSMFEIVVALDRTIQEINALREAFENLRAYAEFNRLENEIKKLEKKIIKQGDLLLNILHKKEI